MQLRDFYIFIKFSKDLLNSGTAITFLSRSKQNEGVGTQGCPFGEAALFIDFKIMKIEYLTGLGNNQNIQKPMT